MHREGKTSIFVPEVSLTATVPPMNPAFYNPRGQYKRDVMVNLVSGYSSGFANELQFADALSGVGVGGLRVGNESRNIGRVFLNDLNDKAMRLASLSIERSGLPETFSKSSEEANSFLSSHTGKGDRFDIVDIDPFGSPVPYLDSALRAIKIGGLLGVTATDGQVLCGIHPGVSLRKYGGYSLNTDYCQEIAIRLMLGSLAFAASRHSLGISPVFAHTAKHYTSIYATITVNPANLEAQLGFISQCNNCPNRTVGPVMTRVCPVCRANCRSAGPLWIGELFDSVILTNVEKLTQERNLQQIFTSAKEEIGLPATFYITDSISSLVGGPSIPIQLVLDSLKELGYNSSRTILNSKGFRTDANSNDIIAIFRSRLD